jgi:hypothetical protein
MVSSSLCYKQAQIILTFGSKIEAREYQDGSPESAYWEEKEKEELQNRKKRVKNCAHLRQG